MMLQRDRFIGIIHEAARNDRDIVFLSADFGAEALDAFREELPDQFMHCGISEQHMIDMAAGLALAGKKVYTYCMGPFVLRAYEQVKQVALMGQPMTIIGAGVGLGYADSGPTHYATEDLACMRALNGIEIFTPADTVTAGAIAELTLTEPGFRYVRLDREALPDLYDDIDIRLGFHETPGKNVCLVSSGYMLHRAHEAAGDAGVIDLFRIKPFPEGLAKRLAVYNAIVTVEEQCLSGGFGSAVIEAFSDAGLSRRGWRMGLPDRYYFENGGRKHLLDTFGLGIDNICDAIRDL